MGPPSSMSPPGLARPCRDARDCSRPRLDCIELIPKSACMGCGLVLSSLSSLKLRRESRGVLLVPEATQFDMFDLLLSLGDSLFSSSPGGTNFVLKHLDLLLQMFRGILCLLRLELEGRHCLSVAEACCVGGLYQCLYFLLHDGCLHRCRPSNLSELLLACFELRLEALDLCARSPPATTR